MMEPTAEGAAPDRHRMAKASRVLLLVASIALGLAYVLPIWTIRLEAPQYPEGLGMVIRLNTIEGLKEHDLNNINNLNHYIGMQRIVPESIPELTLMPWIVAFLMVSGMLVALLGRKKLLYGWTALFLAVSLAGLADFWKWEYDYGHNLDEETAIIKIPGMSYQPPLIGSRQILNFTAHSWPASGGIVLMLAAATGVGLSFRELRSRDGHHRAPERARKGSSAGVARVAGAGLLAAVVSVSCGEPEPRPLMAGVDTCADCLMVLDAGGHGAEIVARTGKVYAFDSVECMVNHLSTEMSEADVASAWVTDFSEPERLVPADRAFYLVSLTLSSPMGLGVTAFGRAEDRDGAVHAFGGDPADWSEVRALVASKWPDGHPPIQHGGHGSRIDPADAGR